MLDILICGGVHQGHEDSWSNSSTPRKSKRSSKNPYSSLGLDKFSALVDDLNEKRQNILSQAGEQDGTLVRFQYSNSNDCVPIVIKLKDQKQQANKKHNGNGNGEITRQKEEQGQDQDRVVVDKVPMEPSSQAKQKEVVIKPSSRPSWINIELFKYRNPCYYLPIVFILILLLLTISGRSAVTLLTSIGWYMLPILSPKKPKITKRRESLRSGEIKTANPKKKEFAKLVSDLGVTKKKELTRKASDVKVVNNRINHGGLKKKEFLRRFSEIKGAKSGASSPKNTIQFDSPVLEHRNSF